MSGLPVDPAVWGPNWKRALVDQLIELTEAEYQAVLRSQRSAQEGATHEEAKPENDKDTRALESSYLARGQAERVIDLRGQLDSLRGFDPPARSEDAPVALGSLVQLNEQGRGSLVCFVAPAGAGATLSIGSQNVHVVTLASPLGRELLGRHQGEEFELVSPRGVRVFELESCC